MTLRDVLLVLGTLPLLGVVATRLASEVGWVGAPPPPGALLATLATFAIVFLVYVALTLRAIARATREILARDGQLPSADDPSATRTAMVSDFAIHLDRTPEIDLRETASVELDDEPLPEPPASEPPARAKLLGEVTSLLTRIPSARHGGSR